MSEINRVSLFGKLNSLGYKSIESATVFCKMRGNPYIELVHWFNQILQLQNSDLHCIVKQFNLDPSCLAKDMITSLDKLPRGSTSISDLSSHVEEAVERGWVYATLMFNDSQIRSGHLLIGVLKTAGLRNVLTTISGEFTKIKIDVLTEKFDEIVTTSPENEMQATDGFQVSGAVPGEASGAMPPAQMGKQEALQKFSIDLTEKARKGELDPIVGRDNEIRQIVDILMRRRQNNPILTGEAGVGKTAVVEGFALRIAVGDIPPTLKDVTLRTLDIGLLQAGASMKGEFEQRLRQVIEEVQSSPEPIILFIDEAHTLIGAGGAAGTGDAANLLKPALARGTLRTIAATTWSEYKKYFEKDPALTRRFQVVQVDEPNEDKAILMMRGMASTMENHHRVQVLDEALEASVRLSHRYIPARQLPDKSVSLLDTACARVAVSQHAVPAEVDDTRHRIDALITESEIILREKNIGINNNEREQQVQDKLIVERKQLDELDKRWKIEGELVQEILDIRSELRGQMNKVEGTDSELEKSADNVAENLSSENNHPKNDKNIVTAKQLTAEQREDKLITLKSIQKELNKLQGENPLILPSVDAQAIASVVADWTGIPVGRMVKNEAEAVLKLGETLNQRVIGQRHALDIIARRIQTSRARLDNPNKPIGVFMLCGPSGVGKTETGLALAESLYGGEQNIITINMSEFQESHSVSTLKGSPPGYVGYGEGGILTEAVRRKPYSVVLLDEIEKAHSDVHEMFFQIFDKGWMEDAEGRFIDFKNTLILLTSNVGTDLVMSMCHDNNNLPSPDVINNALREPLLNVFPPALLGRLVVIPYYPLADDVMRQIIKLQLRRIEKRIEENHSIPFTYDEDVINVIVDRCSEVDSGARVVDSILTNTMLPRISQEFLTKMMQGNKIEKVQVSVIDGDFSYEF